ncbi:hypothetical protein [Neisseria dentiae]|uniref:hypothetical protein n=1 Tax=Neisseria dentiae TaxID=194197 RepID=UPI00211C4ACE|nr:hypothetical protein [Neisseria dentiae]MCQ9326940.1 hypothetical protein [Neisseria dentiae]
MNNDADNIIAEVFRLTGTRITRDDPVLAVLVIQRQSLDEFAGHLAISHEAFLTQLAAHEQNITEAAAKLETYREQLLTELSQHASNEIEAAEPKIYAAVSARVMKDVEASNERLVGRLKKLLAIAFAVALVLMMLFVLLVT